MEPIVYIAIVDSVGNWVYRLPAAKVLSFNTVSVQWLFIFVDCVVKSLQAAEIWPGVGRLTISPRLQAAPNVSPTSVNPCLEDYCLVFTSNCQAKTVAEARAQECGFNGDQGWCGNWMAQMSDTKQPLVPGGNCTRDVRGGVTMPWCVEMVQHRDPSPPPGPHPPSPSPSPPQPPLPPTRDCPKCNSTACSHEGCSWSTPYLCTGGAAIGGCSADPSFWPKSSACTGCCDSQVCTKNAK